jgi:hypothetical protein
MRVQAVPVGPFSQVERTRQSITLGLRAVTTHFSEWVWKRAKSPPFTVKQSFILHDELEELESSGIH